MNSQNKSFDFNGLFWKPFNANTPGNWDVYAERFLGPEYSKCLVSPGKSYDCPYPERHGKSKGKNKLRVKSNFAMSGNFFCSCFENNSISTLELMVSESGFKSRFAAAAEIVETFGVREVQMPTGSSASRTISPEEAHKIEQQRLAKKNALLEQKKVENQKMFAQHSDTWHSNLSSELTKPAMMYIKRRHLGELLMSNPELNDVRFGNLYFNGENTSGYFPAIGSLLRCQKTLKSVGIQRTYFDEHGVSLKRAFNESTSKLCTALIDGVWPVCTVLRDIAANKVINTDTVHIGEGLETIAAVGSCIPTGAVVSTMSADGIEKYEVPDLWKPYIRNICIWADHDEESQTGFKVSMSAAQRLQAQGYNVTILYPRVKNGSKDWREVVEDNLIITLPLEARRDALMAFASVAKFKPLVVMNEDDEAPANIYEHNYAA